MSSRVDQIEFHVRKLAQAAGVEVDSAAQNEQRNHPSSGFDPAVFSSASTVTTDLDIEALSKGLLDISKDLDHYLQTLLQKPDNVSTLKADIVNLEAELREKNQLLASTIDLVRKCEAQFGRVKALQLRSIYHM